MKQTFTHILDLGADTDDSIHVEHTSIQHLEEKYLQQTLES